MAGKVSKLSQLHEVVTELFLEDIKIAREEGIPIAASDKAVIIKFLKDNNITADPDTEDMKELDAEFKKEMEATRKSRAAAVLSRSPASDDDAFNGLFS